MSFWGSKSGTLVGLDIGSSAAKLICLKKSKTGYELQAAGLATFPNDAIVDGIIAKRDLVADEIRRLFQENDVKEERVATSVSGHSVIVKKITLPAQSAEEVRESIQWEAEQYIPFDIADVYLDYHPVGTSEDGTQRDVILVAAKRETIDDQTEVVSMAEKTPIICDIDSFAIHNVYEMNYEPEEDTVVALLNIGASILNVNIRRGSEFIFTRDIAMGGNYYTEYIQRDLGVSLEEAELYKKGGAPEELKPTVSSVIQSVSEILALEIQKTFDYFRTASEFEEIQTIYICGGASQTEGLCEYLQDTFQVPVEFLNPFQNVQMNVGLPSHTEENFGTTFAVAVGLALRAPGDKASQEGAGAAGGLGGLLQKIIRR